MGATTPVPAPVDPVKVDPFVVSDAEVTAFLAPQAVDKVATATSINAQITTINTKLDELKAAAGTTTDPVGLRDGVRSLLTRKKMYEKQLADLNA